MISGCPSHSSISQERREGTSSNLAQTSTWTQRRTDENLVVKGHCDQLKSSYANYDKISHKCLQDKMMT